MLRSVEGYVHNMRAGQHVLVIDQCSRTDDLATVRAHHAYQRREMVSHGPDSLLHVSLTCR